jgi:hypothetical protein
MNVHTTSEFSLFHAGSKTKFPRAKSVLLTIGIVEGMSSHKASRSTYADAIESASFRSNHN